MESTGKLLIGALQNDLRNLSGEARKKHPNIKEVLIVYPIQLGRVAEL